MFGSSKANPEALAISIIATFSLTSFPNMPHSASIFLPRGFRTDDFISDPLVASTKVSSVPSPPSAIGKTLSFASGKISLAAKDIQSAASLADKEPLKL